MDETTEGDERWFAQIEGPEIYMYFEVPSPRIIHEMLIDWVYKVTFGQRRS